MKGAGVSYIYMRLLALQPIQKDIQVGRRKL